MGWHHRPKDRVRLVYRRDGFPYKGRTGTVLSRFGKGGGPKNFAVALESGPVVIVPGGHLKGA